MHNRLAPLRTLLLAAQISKSAPPAELRWLCKQLRASSGGRSAVGSLLKLCTQDALRTAEQEIELCDKSGISLLALFEPEYPQALLQIHDPPLLLFVQGEIHSRYNVALVGSRKCTASGRRIARELAEKLTERGALIISGLARGIDAEAHEGAIRGVKLQAEQESNQLSAGIAVLGSGILSIYPAENRPLAHKLIAQGGAIVSEFRPQETATKYNFPKRNRIVAALCDALIVLEAGEGSGALITAQFALDFNRTVLAVPGDILHPLSLGPNRLIKNGAHLLSELEDVLEQVPPEKKHFIREPVRKMAPSQPTDARFNSVLQLLKKQSPVSFDSIVDALDLPGPVVSAYLCQLELEGHLERTQENSFLLPGIPTRAR